MLAFAGALFSGALAFMVCWREHKSIAHRSFAAGMAVLAAESIFNGFSLHTTSVKEIVYWQIGAGQHFFSAGNLASLQLELRSRKLSGILKRWRIALVLAFCCHCAGWLVSGELIVSAKQILRLIGYLPWEFPASF